MQIICFEDDRVDQLRPVVQARPAYAISCASFRLVDWLARVGSSTNVRRFGHVRPYLTNIQQLDYELESLPDSFDGKHDLLMVNARLVPKPELGQALSAFADPSQASVVIDPDDGSVLVAFVPAAEIVQSKPSSLNELIAKVKQFHQSQATFDAFRWPHDIIRHHLSWMNSAVEWRIEHEDHRQIADGVFVKSDQSLGDYVAVDVSKGPVLLEEGVKIGPFTHLAGPIHIGKNTRIAEHASIKDRVALGHTVKLGGEVEASIIEPFTNKQHHGFLGHSYLGSWINLGAGTCNSDLKNTYGKINVQYGDHKVNTGMQFLGCMVGDYSKSAINTSIFTGKMIGVCSMLYGFVAMNVPSFVNHGRSVGQTAQLPPEVMIKTQQRMFARRQVEQRECDKQLIRDMYRLSVSERDTADFELL